MYTPTALVHGIGYAPRRCYHPLSSFGSLSITILGSPFLRAPYFFSNAPPPQETLDGANQAVFDFWNFQLDWNRQVGKDKENKPIPIPWAHHLPRVLTAAIAQKCGEPSKYAGTHVYASVDPTGDAGLRRFLHAMNSFPGYTAIVKERKASKRPTRCSGCGNEIKQCPQCKQTLRRTTEKGVDTTLAISMIQMAFDNVYDIAVLGSTDADLAPAVRFIYERTGKPVYHLWFPTTGHDLRNACYDHFPMTSLIPELTAGDSG